MARFIIRNYGPSRQFDYEGHQICLSNDQCIETDDEEMAAVLGDNELIHVTDRGVEASDISPQELVKGKEDRQVTVDDAEAVHDERFPDEDAQEQQSQEDQQTDSDEFVDESGEISYDDMTVPELRDLCEDRSIEFPKGYVKRADLIEALVDYDEGE